MNFEDLKEFFNSENNENDGANEGLNKLLFSKLNLKI